MSQKTEFFMSENNLRVFREQANGLICESWRKHEENTKESRREGYITEDSINGPPQRDYNVAGSGNYLVTSTVWFWEQENMAKVTVMQFNKFGFCVGHCSGKLNLNFRSRLLGMLCCIVLHVTYGIPIIRSAEARVLRAWICTPSSN
jgi:hypothetical protein